MKSPKDYLTDRQKEYDKKFNYACFTWNGDNAIGVKCAKEMNRKVKAFLTETIQQSMEVGREQTIETIKKQPKEHYMKWIPTEEQKGYMKACVDIINALSKKP